MRFESNEKGSLSIPGQDQTLLKLVGSLYTGLNPLIAASLISAISVAVAAYWTGDRWVALAGAAMLLVTALRFWLFYRFSKATLSLDNAARWRALYDLGVCAYLSSLGIWVIAIFACTDDPFLLLLSFSGAICHSLGISNRNFSFPASVNRQVLCIEIPLIGACLIRSDTYILLIPTIIMPLFHFIRRSAANLRSLLLEEMTSKLASEEVSAWLEIAIGNINRGLCLLSQTGEVRVINARMRELLQIPTDERIVDSPVSRLFPFFKQIFSLAEFDRALTLYRCALSRRSENEAQLCTKTGRSIDLSIKRNDDGTILIVAQDVTEMRKLYSTIEHMANHDHVTGLPNRAQFETWLSTLRLAAQFEPRALVFIDLDGFKQVNDSLGHRRGDLLLLEAGERLVHNFPPGSQVARWGGDEYVALCAHGQAESVKAIVDSVLESLARPFMIEGYEVVIGASAGIALLPDQNFDPETELRRADIALYAAKGCGRGCSRTFEATMDAELVARLDLERDVRKALSAGEFELFYQPVVNLATRQIISFEALARWSREGQGAVSPEIFVPILESMGLIAEFGAWALQRACLDCATWPETIGVAVNVSALQLSSNHFFLTVKHALESAGLQPQRLELEITESILLEARPEVRRSMETIRRYGAKIALDDFGTRYSSLSYLLNSPVDKLKIDRSFVAAMGGEEKEAAILIESVGNLGVRLGMAVTAEGVETPEQERLLIALGCVNQAQGYLYGKAMPINEVRSYLATARCAAAA